MRTIMTDDHPLNVARRDVLLGGSALLLASGISALAAGSMTQPRSEKTVL
ncbi:hypothetical protein GOL78_11515 [Sinorhizobium medicae]|nr:hypothetical protein [Sinorhizobium medicae]MDX1210160.1 hypothetical protein [Sinorhizobium medicae]